jgi:hypothetical protein
MAAGAPDGFPVAVDQRSKPLLQELYDQLNRETPSDATDRSVITEFGKLLSRFQN